MLFNCGVGEVKEYNPEYSFIGRTDAEDETPILWPPDVKS